MNERVTFQVLHQQWKFKKLVHPKKPVGLYKHQLNKCPIHPPPPPPHLILTEAVFMMSVKLAGHVHKRWGDVAGQSGSQFAHSTTMGFEECSYICTAFFKGVYVKRLCSVRAHVVCPVKTQLHISNVVILNSAQQWYLPQVTVVFCFSTTSY